MGTAAVTIKMIVPMMHVVTAIVDRNFMAATIRCVVGQFNPPSQVVFVAAADPEKKIKTLPFFRICRNGE
jgi:hypothetical protein